MRSLQRRDVTFTVTWRLLSVTREGNKLRATLGSDYGDMSRQRLVDQVVVNHGTRPLDQLYFDLKPLSRNLGEVDYDALTAGAVQAVAHNPEGRFRLFRIGAVKATADVPAVGHRTCAEQSPAAAIGLSRQSAVNLLNCRDARPRLDASMGILGQKRTGFHQAPHRCASGPPRPKAGE